MGGFTGEWSGSRCSAAGGKPGDCFLSAQLIRMIQTVSHGSPVGFPLGHRHPPRYLLHGTAGEAHVVNKLDVAKTSLISNKKDSFGFRPTARATRVYQQEFNDLLFPRGLFSYFTTTMQKCFFLTLCWLAFATAALSQQRVVYGYLKDSLTHFPIQGGTVSNPDLKKKVQTGSDGFFSLPAAPGNLLYVLAPHYQYDTLRYSWLFQDTITLYLSLSNLLETVTVETGYKRYQLDSAERRREFEANRGHAPNVIDRSPQKPYFGLTINLDRLFKRKYRHKQQNEQTFQKMEERQYINLRFSPQLVAFYTGLKGEALLQFMDRYTPSYEWLRTHPYREQVIDYISKKLKEERSKAAAGR